MWTRRLRCQGSSEGCWFEHCPEADAQISVAIEPVAGSGGWLSWPLMQGRSAAADQFGHAPSGQNLRSALHPKFALLLETVPERHEEGLTDFRRCEIRVERGVILRQGGCLPGNETNAAL